VHHDLWDYDTVAQPSLVELQHDGRQIAAVIQATKTGMLFTFNRETGKPVFPIVEKPVPQDGAPGEVLSKTQPFPTAPEPLVRQGPVTKDDLAHISFGCHLERYKSEGIFTPPSVQGSIEQPGYAGGVEWGGLAFDPHRQIAVVNTNDLPMLVALVPRDRLKAQEHSRRYEHWDFSEMTGTPYGMRRTAFHSSWGTPCVEPPWGELTAIDLNTGEFAWRIPFGTYPELLTRGLPPTGTENFGGTIVTKGGLVFIGGTKDEKFHAFDKATGKLLWEYELPAGGYANPSTYMVNGRQYVVIAAGGHSKTDTKRGDKVAFALKR